MATINISISDVPDSDQVSIGMEFDPPQSLGEAPTTPATVLAIDLMGQAMSRDGHEPEHEKHWPSGSLVAAGCEASLRDVMQERWRQISVLGYDADHDATYPAGELAAAATAYLETSVDQLDAQRDYELDVSEPPQVWPWDDSVWAPKRRARRNLVKAVALALAEIDRIDRAAGGDS